MLQFTTKLINRFNYSITKHLFPAIKIIIHVVIYIQCTKHTPNNLLVTKIKNLDGHVAKNWTSIEIQFRIQLDLDFAFNNSLGTKLKIK